VVFIVCGFFFVGEVCGFGFICRGVLGGLLSGFGFGGGVRWGAPGSGRHFV